MLKRHNSTLASSSVTATQFLRENNLALPEPVQSTSQQSSSAPAVQQDASVAARAKAVWDEYVTRRAAHLAQQDASVNTSSLSESITTLEAPSSSDMSWLEHKRQEIEGGPGGDHDTPYRFALPISMKERLAWIHLHRRVQAGEFPA
jgi:soluble lytic murein transglycosylase-like protein